MDQYIYNPPPPPPPPPPSSVTNVDQSNRNRKNTNTNSKFKSNDIRLHPYKRSDGNINKTAINADGDISSIPPEIKEASKDIQQWIAQRKKNWPSAQRVLEKGKELEERKEREKQQEERKRDDQTNTSTVTPTKSICRYFSKGKCRAGNKCKYSHEKSNQPTPIKYKRFEPPDHSSLFKKLVQTDIDNENSQILDFIVYLGVKGLI